MNPFQIIIDWLQWFPVALTEFIAVLTAAFASIFGL